MLSRLIFAPRVYSRRIVCKYLSTDKGEDIWSWIPPRDKSDALKEDFVIPVIKGVLLTPQEVKDSLVNQGAEDVLIIDLKDPIDTITSMVIGTGRSHRHVRKMSDSVVRALKDRQLHYALGSKGVEGEKNDDWQCVDCHKFLVHLLLPEARAHLDLETHWTAPLRPTVEFHHDPKVYEENFVRMINKFPCPPDYIKSPETQTKETPDMIGKL